MKEVVKEMTKRTEQAFVNPGARFGLLYIYVLIVGVIIGLYYVGNLENISRQSVPPVLPDTTVTVTELTVKKAVSVPPVILSEISKPSPNLVSEGEKIYKTNCASCHGDKGAGDGPAATGLNPPPRDFLSKENWVNGTKLSGIYKTLEEGLLPSAMIAYDFLLPEQKFAVAHYIRQTFIPDAEADTEDDLIALDATYNLSAGVQLAAQIPVSSASAIIENESKTKVENIIKLKEKISSLSGEAGYSVFNEVVKNENTALTFLTINNEWKKSEDSFINLLVNNVNQNGFNGSIYNLSSNEWNVLFNFMNKLI